MVETSLDQTIRDSDVEHSPDKVSMDTEKLKALLEAADVEAFNKAKQEYDGKIVLKGVVMEPGSDLTGIDLESVTLIGVVFNHCDLSNAKFDGAKVQGGNFKSCTLNNTTFCNADLSRADFTRAVGNGTDFSGEDTDCTNAYFNLTVFENLKAVGTKLNRSVWYKATGLRCDFTEASAVGMVGNGATFSEKSVFYNTNLTELKCSGMSILNSDLRLATIKDAKGKNFSVSGSWCDQTDIRECVFGGDIDFEQAYIQGLKHDFGKKAERYFEKAIADRQPPEGKFDSTAAELKDSSLVHGIPGSNKVIYKTAKARIASYIGLENWKAEVRRIEAAIQVKEKARLLGKNPAPPIRKHYSIEGPPGTCKSTAVEDFALLLYALGQSEHKTPLLITRSKALKGGVGRTDEYLEEELLPSMIGRVVQVEEAYSFYKEGSSVDYGRDFMNAMVDFMERRRGDFVSFFLGYPPEMETFKSMNTGFASRVSVIPFDHLNSGEAIDLLKDFLKDEGKAYDKKYLAAASLIIAVEDELAGDKYGNGRFVRDEVYYGTESNQSIRLADSGWLDEKNPEKAIRMYDTFRTEDLPFKAKLGFDHTDIDFNELRWIDPDSEEEVTYGQLNAYRGRDVSFPRLSPESLQFLLEKREESGK